jgi:hypothetical protein
LNACPSSLLHLISGLGKPSALHLKLTEESSRTSVSELVSSSKKRGGTKRKNKAARITLGGHSLISYNLKLSLKSWKDKDLQTNDMQISDLAFHGISIDLAHIFPTIFLSNIMNVKIKSGSCVTAY